jgi:hypothetical protein
LEIERYRDYQRRVLPGFLVPSPLASLDYSLYEAIFADADRGNYRSQILLGELFEIGIDGDLLRSLRAGAESDSLAALYLLGRCYELGRGVAPNPELAAELFQRGSNQRSALCQARLGLMYLYDRGVARSAANRPGAEYLFAEASASLQCGMPGRGLLKLQIVLDSAHRFPEVGQYFASDTGSVFLDTVFANFRLSADQQYSITYEDAAGQNPTIWRSQTLSDQGIRDGTVFTIINLSAAAASAAPFGPDLMVHLADYDVLAPVIGSIQTGVHRASGNEVLLHAQDPFDQARFMHWTAIWQGIQHPVFLRFLGFCLPDVQGNVKATIVTSAVRGGLVPLSEKLEVPWSATQEYQLLVAIAGAIRYLHSIHIVLPGLSMATVLLDEPAVQLSWDWRTRLPSRTMRICWRRGRNPAAANVRVRRTTSSCLERL